MDIFLHFLCWHLEVETFHQCDGLGKANIVAFSDKLCPYSVRFVLEIHEMPPHVTLYEEQDLEGNLIEFFAKNWGSKRGQDQLKSSCV